MVILHKQMLELHKCESKIEKEIFIQLTEAFRLPNEEIIDYTIEEQELISNYVDPIPSPLLHNPEKGKLFLWLDKTVSKSYNTRPDAGCAFIQERRLKNYSGFAEVKAEYKKKDSLCTHQDLLRLALFGINAIEEYATKCILMIQAIGSTITYYGCVEHTNGPKIIFEISKIKIPSSMQDFPGFIMKLDNLKKLGEFYHHYCVKNSNTINMKRKSSHTNINLDKIINCHKPKNLKLSVDF